MWRGVGSKHRKTTPATTTAQPPCAHYWAPLTWKRHHKEHRPQRPTERSDLTQHAKGRKGDCPGPRKETATRRNVTQGALVGPNGGRGAQRVHSARDNPPCPCGDQRMQTCAGAWVSCRRGIVGAHIDALSFVRRPRAAQGGPDARPHEVAGVQFGAATGLLWIVRGVVCCGPRPAGGSGSGWMGGRGGGGGGTARLIGPPGSSSRNDGGPTATRSLRMKGIQREWRPADGPERPPLPPLGEGKTTGHDPRTELVPPLLMDRNRRLSDNKFSR